MKIINPSIRFKDKELGIMLDICGETYDEALEEIIREGYKDSYDEWHEEGYQVMFNGVI